MKALQNNLILAAAGFAAWLALSTPPAFSLVTPDDEEEDETEEAEEDADHWYAVTGGDVYTGTGAFLRGATVLSKNGKIEELGYGIFIPEDAETLDASGYRVYPGLVAVQGSTRISRGMFATEQELEPQDDHGHGQVPATDPLHPDDDWEAAAERLMRTGSLDEQTEPSEPELAEEDGPTGSSRPDFEHGFDPFSSYLVMALATGVTTADQSGTTIKLKRGEIDGVSMREKHLASFSWSTSGRASLREKFGRAREYLREMETFEEEKKRDKELKEPSKKGVDSAVLDVLEGRKLAKFSSNDREDLLGIARFAQQHRFRPVIQGCREGWTVAEELGRAGAFAVVTPRDRRAKDERLLRDGGSSIENAAILHRSGVQVAIIPANTSFDLSGIAGRDLLHFPVEAGFAVRGGMTNEDALAGITIIPARILGVDHRVGTLEVGKDMDVIVTDGDILHYQTFVQWTVVDGKLVYDKQDELLFHHIRPRPEPEVPLEPEIDEEAQESEDSEEDSEEGEEEGGEEEADEEEEEVPEGGDEEEDGEGDSPKSR